MPLLGKEVIDLEYPTGFATSPGQAAVAGGAAVGKPFIPAPLLPPDRYGVLDITVSPATGVLAPAAKGTLLVAQTIVNPFSLTGSQGLSLAANNTTAGLGFWAQAGSDLPNVGNLEGTNNSWGAASAPIPESMRGIVEQVGVGPGAFPNTSPLQYARATIVVRGPVQALCVAPQTSNAINVGSLLCSDGNGNLQPLPIPALPTGLSNGFNGGSFGISTTSACPAYALVGVSKDGTYSAITANFGVSTAISLGNTVPGVSSSPNGVLLNWNVPADNAATIVMRTGSVGLSAVGNPNLVGAIGFVPGGENYFIDFGQIPLSGTSATQAFARPSNPSSPLVTQVAGAAAGAATIAYAITAIQANGVWSTESAAASNGGSVSNANPSPTNGNKITWTNVTGVAMYAVDRTTSKNASNAASTTGFIGFATSLAAINGFVDYGQTATVFSTVGPVLTPLPTPQSGVALAIAAGSLAAATSTPTLTSVIMGNLG